MSTRVLVTDGEERAALAVVRSLGRAGYRPLVCSSRTKPLAGASRFAVAEARTRDPREDPQGYAREVEELLERWRVDVLLPVTDASLLALLSRRRRWPEVRLPFPPLAVFREVSDKRVMAETARGLGLAVPETWRLPRKGAGPGRDAPPLTFPLVVKPARSVVEAGGSYLEVGVSQAEDQDELEACLDALPREAYPVLLQERIVGQGTGVFLLRWRGETLAAFAHRRIREKPPWGGVSVYRESVPLEEDLRRRSELLLEHFGWEGVAMVEFKREETSGIPFLMEVNGRFWGSLQLAVDAGVDFPRLLTEAALGLEPEPVTRYRTGVRCRWWWGEVDHLLTRLRRPSRERRIPPGTPGSWSALSELVAPSRPGDRTEVLRLDDPRPFLRESARWLSGS